MNKSWSYPFFILILVTIHFFFFFLNQCELFFIHNISDLKHLSKVNKLNKADLILALISGYLQLRASRLAFTTILSRSNSIKNRDIKEHIFANLMRNK